MEYFFRSDQTRPLLKIFDKYFADYEISNKNSIIERMVKSFGGEAYFRKFIDNKYNDTSICDKLSKEIDPLQEYDQNGMKIGSQLLGYLSIF